MSAQVKRLDGGAEIIAAFLASGVERRGDVTAAPSAAMLGSVEFWYDPTKARIFHHMTCMRCEHEGMLILGSGVALCLARCPKPWVCKKCNGLNVPMHARWCERAADPPDGRCPECFRSDR